MKELYELISSLPPEMYTLVAVLIGMLLIDDLNPDEQRALGGFFALIGEVLWVNSSQVVMLTNRMETNRLINMEKELQVIKKKMGII